MWVRCEMPNVAEAPHKKRRICGYQEGNYVCRCKTARTGGRTFRQGRVKNPGYFTAPCARHARKNLGGAKNGRVPQSTPPGKGFFAPPCSWGPLRHPTPAQEPRHPMLSIDTSGGLIAGQPQYCVRSAQKLCARGVQQKPTPA